MLSETSIPAYMIETVPFLVRMYKLYTSRDKSIQIISSNDGFEQKTSTKVR